MMTDKLMVLVRGADTELGRITALLSSMADMPPVIPYELKVLGEPGSHRLAQYCGECVGVGYAERTRDLGEEIDDVASTSGCNLQLVLHPDVIFTNPAWCEVIFSKMIETGAVVMGPMPFRPFKVRDREVPIFAPWFVAYDAQQVARVGGFSSDCGEASWLSAYLRAKKASMHCVGADLSHLVVHTGRCWLDVGRDPAELLRDEQSVEIVVIKEYLL